MVVTLLTAFCMMLSAQERKVMNRPYIDQRTYHYGFFFGTHLQDLEFQNNGFTDEEGNQWFADVPNYDPGFSVGILGELRLHDNIALRAIPTMHFGQRHFKFKNLTNPDEEVRQQTLKTTYVALPLDIKFASQRYNNIRPYISAGITPVLNITGKKQDILQVNNSDVFLNLSVGCDRYLPFFKLIPELRFCYGLSNCIDKKHVDELTDVTMKKFTNAVSSGHSKMIILTLYFE